MPTLKDVELKIKAVKKTKQITKAMNMVATSRMRGAQAAMEGFRPYAAKFAEVLGSLAEKAGEEASPLLVPRDEVKNVHIVLCTSDRGLCGGFNSNLISKAEKYMASRADENLTFTFTNFGKKGRDWCRKNGQTMVEEHLGIVGAKFGFNVASTAGKKWWMVSWAAAMMKFILFTLNSSAWPNRIRSSSSCCRFRRSKPLKRNRWMRMRLTRPNIFVSRPLTSCLAICCRGMYMYSFTVLC